MDTTNPLAAVGSSEGLGGFTLQEVTAFLDGSAPLDGVWFGEPHPTERGQFWWRKHLCAATERVPLTYRQIMDCAREADWPPSMISAFVQAKLEVFARTIERKCAESWGVKLEEQG